MPRSCQSHQPAGVPLAYLVLDCDVAHGCPKSRRRYQFFESMSFSARLSSVSFATTCSSFRFSPSSCFSFFASPLSSAIKLCSTAIDILALSAVNSPRLWPLWSWDLPPFWRLQVPPCYATVKFIAVRADHFELSALHFESFCYVLLFLSNARQEIAPYTSSLTV